MVMIVVLDNQVGSILLLGVLGDHSVARFKAVGFVEVVAKTCGGRITHGDVDVMICFGCRR